MNKKYIDTSSIDMDGSHIPCMRGGEVSYQGCKNRMIINSLFISDRQGIMLAMSTPIKVEHHDFYNIESSFKDMIAILKLSDIFLDGVFINADAEFDSKLLRNNM